MQKVFADIGDVGVNLLNSCFCLLPVITELLAAVLLDMTHATLVLDEPFFVFPECVKRLDVAAIAQGCKASDANVDPFNTGKKGA